MLIVRRLHNKVELAAYESEHDEGITVYLTADRAERAAEAMAKVVSDIKQGLPFVGPAEGAWRFETHAIDEWSD